MTISKIFRIILVGITLTNILLATPYQGTVSAAANISTTKDLSLELTVDAERYSDIQYYVENPAGEVQTLPLFINDSDRIHTQYIPLGETIDEKEGCVDIVNVRRTGICEDGVYKIYVQSIDAVGNKSDYSVMEVERDTVRPGKPEGELYICGLNICLRIESSEPNSYVNNGTEDLGQVDSNGRGSFVVLRAYTEDTVYNLNFISKDRAWNESDTLSLSIHTPSFGRGGGGESILGSSDNVYAGLSADDLNQKLNVKAYGRPDGTLETVQSDVIPSVITYISNVQGDGNIIVYGVGLTKGQKVDATIEVHFKAYSLEESTSKCGITIGQYLLDPGNSCVAGNMYFNASGVVSTDCPNQLLTTICNKHLPPPVNGLIVNKDVSGILDKVEVNMYRNGKEFINPLRESYGYGLELPNKAYLNEKENGRFEFAYQKPTLEVGQKISSSVKVFGELKMNYNGFKFKSDLKSKGWESEKGNEYEVPGEVNPEVIQCMESTNRLPWPGGQSHYVSQDWQNPGGSHSPGNYNNQWAIDFDHQSGNDVVAMDSGEIVAVASSYVDLDPKSCDPSKAANVNRVAIKHVEGTSLYLHLKKGSVTVKLGDVVTRGQKIGESGTSGFTCGAHLHVTNQDSSTVNAGGYGKSIPMKFSDSAVCNDTYKGVPQYNKPDTHERQSFISDNY